jgi:hypothetical protein
MPEPGKDNSSNKRHLAWRAGAIVVLIVVLIAALLSASIVTARKDALAQARLQNSFLSAALAEDAEGSLDTAAVASELVKRRVEAEGDATPLAELKKEISKYVRHLINISLIGPDGRLRATSGDVASSPASFSQFDFFIANRDSTEICSASRISVSRPATSSWTSRIRAYSQVAGVVNGVLRDSVPHIREQGSELFPA